MRERTRRLLLRAARRGLHTLHTPHTATRPSSPSLSSGERREGVGGRVRSRLLLIRPDHLGDVLLLTPALRALRRNWPEAEITVTVDPGSTPALARNRDLDALIPFPFPGIARAPAGGPLTPYVTLLQAARDLRARLRPFDAAIVLRADHWWGAALAATAGIPRRFGFAHPDTAPFLTDALPLASRRHAARGNLALLDAVAAAAGRE
ncbi:MAG: hypothetical protein AVDCRST_MAG88-4045, partial [uncultured Thermomicrobiales bacterium]